VLDESNLHIQRRKAVALLTYLAVTQTPHRRDALATLLWPDFDQTGARDNLRRTLSALHQAFDHNWLVIDRTTVHLPPQPELWVDVVSFDQLLTRVQRHHQPGEPLCDECLSLLNQAAQLYTGDFLAGFTLDDSPGFDEWQAFESERLRLAYAGVLARLGEAYCGLGEYETAIHHARRWVALDPLHEPAHRLLMRLYAETDQAHDAIRQYERCRQLLQEELGAPPAAETTALYEQIRHRQPGLVRPVRQPTNLLRAPHTNLPTQTTLFIGREAEMAELKRLLLEQTGCRLLNLVGPGGIGKTRLALATAAQTLDAFPDGVFFVALAPVSEVAFLVPAIAEALRFSFHGTREPQEQLLDYLRSKQLLLIVDNFEHLLAGAELLSQILQEAPHVTILATARERLNLQEEWVYTVEGLAFPPAAHAHSVAQLDNYSAVALFLQRARQVVSGFTPTAAELVDIARICQLVEGMPLGVELAAPWIRSLHCAEIAQEIERNLDFLTTSLRNVPERHRSLRVMFEQTWGRLSAAEQAVLCQLSVFRGGCTRPAAEQVTGATLPILSSLVDKALLRRTASGRYELHELIRQFAEAQLLSDPAAVNQTQQRHQDFFITLLETRTAGIKGDRQKAILVEIKADMDNVRLAWRRAVANRDASAIARAAECLLVYFTYSSTHYEGQIAFQEAVAALATIPDSPTAEVQLRQLNIVDQQENLVGFLLAVQAYFLARTSGRQVISERVIAELLQAKPGNWRKAGVGLAFLSWAVGYQGRIADSLHYAERALTFSVETGELLGQWWSLLAFGSQGVHSRPERAEQFLRRAQAVCEQSGDPSARGFTYQNLAWVLVELGNYGEAAQFCEQGVTIFEELGNTQGLGNAYFRRGQLAIALGDYGGAIQALLQGVDYFLETQSVLHASFVRIWLGIAYRLQGDHHQAEQTSREALATFKAINDPVHSGYCLLNLGCLAQDQGNLGQAEHLQREALGLWQQAGQEARVADAARCLGHLILAVGEHRHTEARRYFQQALALAIEHQLAPIALDVCIGVAQLRAQSGEMQTAIELLTLAAHHEASTFETRENARQLLVKLLDQAPAEATQVARSPEWDRGLWNIVQDLLPTLQRQDETMLPLTATEHTL
jgi:predicted ATPase/DNA-binding SARP family transcriptional activator